MARLQRAPDYSLQVSVAGYQFPEIESGWDANWLMIEMQAVAGSHRWRARQPALETTELARLVSWLRERAAAAPSNSYFGAMEPNLAFTAARDGQGIRLTVLLRLEFADPDIDVDQQFEGSVMAFSTTAEDLSRFAAELETEGSRFPIRPKLA